MEAIFPNEDRMLRVDAVTQISNFKSQELEMQRKTFKPSATSKRHQKGYTLIELGIAIAIVAVLIVGGLAGVQAITTSGKISDQTKTLGRLQSTISKNYQNTVLAAANNQAQLVTLGAWDARSVNAAGVVTSAFGTVEAIAPNGVAIGSMLVNQGFVYTIAGVPQAACTDLAQSLAPLAFAISITANGAAGAAGAPNWALANNPSLAKAPDAQAWNAGGIAAACAGLAPATFSIALKP